MPPTQSTLLVSNASLYLVEGQRTLDVRTGGDYTRQRTKRAGRVL